MEPVSDQGPARASVLERALVSIAVAGLFAMALLITTNIVSRWIGRSIIPDDVLLVEQLMVVVVLLPLAAVTALRQHICVEVFVNRTSPATKRVLTVVAHIVGLAFGGLLFWAAARNLLASWRTQDYYNGVLHIPMWLGHGVFVFAVGLFIARLFVMLVADIREMLASAGR